MKYSEAKRRIRVIRGFGYDKHIGINHFYKRWRHEINGKIFNTQHMIGYEFEHMTVDDLTQYIIQSEYAAIDQLRRAVIMGGY